MLTITKNGVPQFTADQLESIHNDVWNFSTNAPPPPPAGRLTSALVTWFGQPPRNTDVTRYSNLAGGVDNPPRNWWSAGGTRFTHGIPATKYVAAFIDAPPVGTPVSNHMIKIPLYIGSANLDISLSDVAGDFNPATAVVVKLNCPMNDQPLFWFTNGPGTAFYHAIGAGKYLNYRITGGRLGTAGLATQ